MMIQIAKYAEKHGVLPNTVRKKAIRGGYKTATKMGRDWFIDEDEPYIDLRKKSLQDNK